MFIKKQIYYKYYTELYKAYLIKLLLLLLYNIVPKKRVYLCNVQHCIYKVHLNTGFSSNTETTINRFDITVFFSSAVFKLTQKCIFNNLTTPTNDPHTVSPHASQVVQVHDD